MQKQTGRHGADSIVVKGVEVRRGMTVRARADGKERALLVTDIMEDQHGQYMQLFRSIPNHAGKSYLVQSDDWKFPDADRVSTRAGSLWATQ